MKDLKVILHATDFSPNAQAALSMACELARRRDARLVILHVTYPVPCHWPGNSPSALYSCEHLKSADRELRTLDCGRLFPERMLRTGEPAEVILSVAERVGADLIVVGQPQPGKWRWLFEERVAQTVVRRASCPVLVVGGLKAQPSQAPELSRQALRDSAAAVAEPLAVATGRKSDQPGLFGLQPGGAVLGVHSCRHAAAP